MLKTFVYTWHDCINRSQYLKISYVAEIIYLSKKKITITRTLSVDNIWNMILIFKKRTNYPMTRHITPYSESGVISLT